MDFSQPPTLLDTCDFFHPPPSHVKLDLLICIIMTKSLSINSIDIWIYELPLTYLLLICPANILKHIHIAKL